MITKSEAKEVAINECAKRGWKWSEPVLVKWRLFSFVIWTNANRKGGNVCIRIRKKNGEILQVSQTPK